MTEGFSLAGFPDRLETWVLILRDRLLVPESLVQAGLAVLALVLCLLLARPIQGRLRRSFRTLLESRKSAARFTRTAIVLLPLILCIALLRLLILTVGELGFPSLVLRFAELLLMAWVFVRLLSSLFLKRTWARTLSLVVLFFLGLHYFGLLAPLLAFLDALSLTIGSIRVSVLLLLKLAAMMAVLLRLGLWLGDYVDHELQVRSTLSPSVLVLVSKTFKILLISLVVIITLDSVGIDITTLQLFGGAVGLGIGFGLQSVIANFVSGIILLTDKSIKPGDVIQIGDVYGWISKLRGRYVSVVTRDGKEYLIPNQDLITQQVINWSYSDRNVRLRIPVGISYRNDPHQAAELVREVARDVPRVLAAPEPVCLITGFGNSSVDLELRIWINDPQSGLANIRSEILGRVWDAFHEHGIEIPFPQRDVHVDLQPGFFPLRIAREEKEASGRSPDQEAGPGPPPSETQGSPA